MWSKDARILLDNTCAHHTTGARFKPNPDDPTIQHHRQGGEGTCVHAPRDNACGRESEAQWQRPVQDAELQQCDREAHDCTT